MTVERDELRTQIPDLLHKGAYQLGLGALAYMGRAECINAPALRLAARDQPADANDLMQRMFGKPGPERLADVSLGRLAHVEHPCRCL